MAVHLAAFGSLAVWCLCVSTAWSGEVHDAARAGDLPGLSALLADNPQSAHACDSKDRTPASLGGAMRTRAVRPNARGAFGIRSDRALYDF